MTIQENFKGIRNDLGSKHISPEFVYDATNVNNDSIVGVDSILYPERASLPMTQISKDFRDAVLYSFENDTFRVDSGVTASPQTINSRNMVTHYYGTGSNSTLSTLGIDGRNIIVSFWATNMDRQGYILRKPASDGIEVLWSTATSKLISLQQSGGNLQEFDLTYSASALSHYLIVMNGTTMTQSLYVNGQNVAVSNSVSGSIASLTLPTQYIGGPTPGSQMDKSIFDLSILSLSALSSYVEQDIVNYIYNNNSKGGNYAFVYEYDALEAPVDGIVEYRYLDSTLSTQTESIGITGGTIFKNWESSPQRIAQGLTPGLCQFTTFNDKLLIVNGKDYPLWYNGATGNFYQMGAPEANQGSVGGVLNGTFYYALSYTTAGGDDILGTVSNTITTNGRKIALTLPIPYDASIVGMKLYRTTAGGSQLKLLHTFTTPTPLTYEDNELDSALGADIGAVTNEMIRPYFVESVFDKIIMSVVDKYPTQCFIGESGIEVIDPSSNFIDLANQASDNTPIVGMELDYNQIVLGTNRNMILIDPSTDPATVTFTRSNVGVLNGYSMCRVPANGTFDGGVMFVSTMADVRLLSGYKAVIPETVNDISTDNMAQVIQGTLPGMVRSANIINSAFYDYKYHLIVGEIMWVFDIRTQSWWKYDIRSENYVSSPTCFGISGGTLYTGQSDGWIERMYADMQYNGEDVVSSIESGTMTVNDAYKFMKDWKFWLYTSPNTELNIKIILDDDIANAIEATFNVGEGYFDPMHFSGIFYDVGTATEDYRNFNISRMARWVKFILKCNSGRLYFRGYDPGVEILRNKEG